MILPLSIRVRWLLGTVLAVSLPGHWGTAQEAALEAKLAALPHPWTQPMHRLSRDEYRGTLRYWQDRYPQRLRLTEPGRSREGEPVFLLRITDQETPDTDKQVALITALHGGPERSGSTTALALAEFLLGEDREAAEIRRHQIVLLMPIPNPHAFFTTDRFGNSAKIDPYNTSAHWDLANLRLKNPADAPEVAAVLQVIDQHQPEVHIDLHGTGLQEYPDQLLGQRTGYQGQTMFEVTGSAYSNYSLRPWDWRITETMAKAGESAGFPSDRFEADAQRLFAGPGMEQTANRFWSGRPLFYTAHYGYAKYHTLISALEIGWEASGVARTLGLLRAGNGSWRNDPVPGYPVNRVKSFVGHFVVARGATAAQRRVARTAWWQAQHRLGQAILYPQTDGRDTYLVSLNSTGDGLLHEDPAVFVERLRERPEFNAQAIATFFRHGPEIKLAIEAPKEATNPEPLPSHDLGLLLRLPYDAPQVVDLRLNGHEVAAEHRTSWLADGWTHLEIHVPAERVARECLLIVTCAYRPNRERTTGWVPPAEVLRTLKTK